ncbi:MAG: response regulator [Bdellovibrionales bacterium]
MSEESLLSEITLNSLRQKYFARLVDRIDRIAGLFAQSNGRDLSPDECNALRTEAHSLVGSGATYGFPNITVAASALEAATLANEDQAALWTRASDLISVCKSIIPNDMQRQPVSFIAPETTLPVVAQNGKQEFSGKKILLIDDDPAMQDLISKLFEKDATILTASDGQAGLDILRRQKPDLTLLDISMPGMGGLSMLETLEHDEDLRQSPVIMLSAHHEQSYVAKAMMSWALGYIVKPFDINAFASRVRNLLARLTIKVLVADDDEAIRDMLWHKFRTVGLRAILAADGTEAQELIVTQRPRLAIIDWMMPGLDGAALLRRVKSMAENVQPRIIMLTARHQEQDVLEALKLGAEDYITKPFFPDELVVRSLRLLGLKDIDSA